MENEKELRLHRCCFTGHRPEKLHLPDKQIVSALRKEILCAIHDGYVTFLSGMARGVDIWAAETVLELKQCGYPIHLVCASPYMGVEAGWTYEWRRRYENTIAAADIVKYISPCYSQSCFHIRNKWLVDHANRVIAVYNGESGGTKNTVQYAARQGIQTIIIK